ncbi:MAG: hypothetical protein AAFW95_09355 [Cyanobacteria bacterium J06638_6]
MTSTLATVFGFSSLAAVLSNHGQRRSRLAISPRVWRWLGYGLLFLLLGLAGCGRFTAATPRQIVLRQSWEIESGDRVAGQLVTGSLGDISVQLRGTRLRAPFVGQVELAAKGFHCIYFSSPEVPAYLFRYCGVRRPQIGPLQAGEVMGRGQNIHFATLRRQPDGAWAIVEPSDRVLERSLNQPTSTLSF